MSRRVAIVLMALSLSGLIWTGVAANQCAGSLCVYASNKVNGSSAGATVAYHSTATDSGNVQYQCWLGPIPFICDIYFVQTFAYWPFGLPSVTGGNISGASYTFGTSSATGQSGWNYNGTGTIAGNATLYLSGQAYADEHTGSSTYWNATGTGNGHLVDDNYRNRVTVP